MPVDGCALGVLDSINDGIIDGLLDGFKLGVNDVTREGKQVELREGPFKGLTVGATDGRTEGVVQVGVADGTADDCALGALDVRLGIAEGEPVELRVGYVVCFAAGTVDGAPDGVANCAADGFVLGADMVVAAG